MYASYACKHHNNILCICQGVSYMYLEEAAEREGSLEEDKAVPQSPGGSSLEVEGNHTHPVVNVCECV